MIAVVGASGAGKTVYLGMLMDMLSRHPSMFRTTARGPLSITLQQTTTTALSNGSFPDRTASPPEHWNWAHCQIHCRRRRRPLELVIPDISGAAFTEETERDDRYPAIRSLLTKCSGLMVLIDAQQLQTGDHSQDFITMKLLSMMGELRGQQPRSRLRWGRERCPVALVLTKADACEGCAEDPRKFAEAHAGALLGNCELRFDNCEVFACSVAGATAYRDLYGRRQRVPLRIEPRGIVEPLGWLVTELN